MGRRTDEQQTEQMPAEIAEKLDDLLDAFSALKFPNVAMVSLADLALAEYRLAVRSIDRKHWHGQLLAVAKACQEFNAGKEDGKPSDAGLEVVHHGDEGGDERRQAEREPEG